ncbi:MAG TPA: hypothetical protein DEP19_00170, partial [Anaerolineae bacterium]|nr:hypothetical protein [Anaerolineae bacterium]
MTNTTIQTNTTALEQRKRISYGMTLLVVGILIYLFFGINAIPGAQTTFGLNLLGSQAIQVSDLVVPAQGTIYLMVGIVIFAGAYQLARGVKSTGLLIGIIAFTFVTAFLTWA